MIDDIAVWIVEHDPKWMPRPLRRWALNRFANILRITDALREGTEFERKHD